MNPTQRRERRLDIEGELKMAEAMVTECEQRRTEKERALALAEADVTAAKGRLSALEDECRQLAEESRADFLSLIKNREEVIQSPPGEDAQDELRDVLADGPVLAQWGDQTIIIQENWIEPPQQNGADHP
jgi:hypothetical protein